MNLYEKCTRVGLQFNCTYIEVNSIHVICIYINNCVNIKRKLVISYHSLHGILKCIDTLLRLDGIKITDKIFHRNCISSMPDIFFKTMPF